MYICTTVLYKEVGISGEDISFVSDSSVRTDMLPAYLKIASSFFQPRICQRFIVNGRRSIVALPGNKEKLEIKRGNNDTRI